VVCLAEKAGGEDELGQMHRHAQAAYLCNIENATSILWNEIDKSSIIAFANIGADTIEVIEEPEAIIRGQ
jgi:tartrate dehydratase beta subunit/fumarate hydratase class I family protein